jgi:prepilin-type N-terminal cleavage/methylation domain-containing protein
VERHGLVSVLKESSKMRQANKRVSQNGFTLLETMIALVVLGVGILGLAAMLTDALTYMQGSQADFIAQQKAEEAAEAIFTAKYSNNATFAQIQNFSVGSPGGLFLAGPQPLLVPGPDGLVGSVNDVGAPPASIITPGPDKILGTADDVTLPLGAYTRTINIFTVPGKPNLRQVNITINYTTGRFTKAYNLTTYVSAF